MTFKQRLLYALPGWLTAAFIYVGCGVMKGSAWVIPETPVDQMIAFSASGIWLYLSFYIFIPYAFFTVEPREVKCLSISFIVVSVLSGIIFVFLPSTIVYPQFEIDSVSSKMLAFVSSNDTELNCFPSLHASLIALCSFALLIRAGTFRRIFVILVTLAMFYAIIQVRRHVFIDLAGGFFLAILVWLAITKRFKSHVNQNKT